MSDVRKQRGSVLVDLLILKRFVAVAAVIMSVQSETHYQGLRHG